MDIRRVKVPTALVWADPKQVTKGDQAYLADGDLTAWLKALKDSDRERLADQNSIVTEALFNDRVVLDQVVDQWAHVFVTRQINRQERRGYPGWLPLSQLTANDEELDYPTTTVRLVQPETVLRDDQGQPVCSLPMGTLLTTTGQDDQQIKVLTPLGKGTIAASAASLHIDGATDGDRLLNLGKQFLGTPYLWGGITPEGFDCSGFVYALHRALNYVVPRDAQDQFANGYPVAPEELACGDLVFFATDHGEGQIHHVALYAGEGQMLHSPKPGFDVELIPMTTAKYAAEYAGARRLWQ